PAADDLLNDRLSHRLELPPDPVLLGRLEGYSGVHVPSCRPAADGSVQCRCDCGRPQPCAHSAALLLAHAEAAAGRGTPFVDAGQLVLPDLPLPPFWAWATGTAFPWEAIPREPPWYQRAPGPDTRAAALAAARAAAAAEAAPAFVTALSRLDARWWEDRAWTDALAPLLLVAVPRWPGPERARLGVVLAMVGDLPPALAAVVPALADANPAWAPAVLEALARALTGDGEARRAVGPLLTWSEAAWGPAGAARLASWWELVPDLDPWGLHRARLLQAAGRPDEARRLLEAVYAAHPQAAAVRQALLPLLSPEEALPYRVAEALERGDPALLEALRPQLDPADWERLRRALKRRKTPPGAGGDPARA
ncbi:MAG: hypothetical protein OWV35_10760, partial [Firmicutes bacterium]|nr:hypothetical protein [Bacillota bacterium]